MQDNPSEFSQRLLWALERLGICQPNEQVTRIANAAGVSKQTAKRYLSGKSRPKYFDRYDALATDLDIFVGWLVYGKVPYRTAEEARFVTKILCMTVEERDKMHKLAFLLRNGSKRVMRLFKLVEIGHISPATFLDLALQGSRVNSLKG